MALRPVFVLATLACLVAVTAPAAPPDRSVANDWEIHHELTVAADTQRAAARYFPTFAEYQNLVLYHPRVGYYASGRVDFGDDFRTFPHALAPYFGHMVAEQVFRMWAGMRLAGTLSPDGRFTIAEFGGGNGLLAESILTHVNHQAQQAADARWREFARQMAYVCYDRAPALMAAQRTRNARFGPQFEARDADATAMDRTIDGASLTGVILSNELLDVFGVQKVVLSPGAAPEAAYVAARLPARAWRTLQPRLPLAVRQLVSDQDAGVERDVFHGQASSGVWLSRASLVATLEALVPSPTYASDVRSIEFQEVYLPADTIPALAAHLDQHRARYAAVAARRTGLVTYVSPDIDAFARGAAHVLRAGYVLTIDYGADWDGILARSARSHLRVFGPSVPLTHTAPQVDAGPLATVTDRRAGADPYRAPTLNDITTDVNFGHLADTGARLGLNSVHFGPQRDLQHGTRVSLDTPPSILPGTRRLDYAFWVGDFARNDTFKLLVQQRAGTDPDYRYPAPGRLR